MVFIRFDKTFLESLQLATSGLTDTTLDDFLEYGMKNFLFNRQTFYAVGSTDLTELKSQIQDSYEYLLKSTLPKYEKVLEKVIGGKTTIETRNLTTTSGDIKTENSYFEPVVSATQNEVKNNASKTTTGNDTDTGTITTQIVGEDTLLIEFFNNLQSSIENAFCQFINYYC